MQLQPFSLFRTLLHLSGQLLGVILAPVHYRVQQRRQARILAAAPASPRIISLTPTEVETLRVSEATAPRLEEPPMPEPLQPELPVLVTQPASSDSAAGSSDRQQIVIALLDEAYSIGKTTYPELIAYVEQHTGTGCSRRVISNWKKSRRLMAESEAA